MKKTSFQLFEISRRSCYEQCGNRCLTGCNNSAASSSVASSGAAVYTPGTYTAKAVGMGDITVSMTFTENAITNVVVDTANETIDLARDAADEFQKALMEAQSEKIEGISGATYTSDAVRKAAASCIQQAMGVSSGDHIRDARTPCTKWIPRM